MNESLIVQVLSDQMTECQRESDSFSLIIAIKAKGEKKEGESAQKAWSLGWISRLLRALKVKSNTLG